MQRGRCGHVGTAGRPGPSLGPEEILCDDLPRDGAQEITATGEATYWI